MPGRTTHNGIPALRAALEQYFTIQAPRVAGNVLMDLTIDRTQKGRDVDGDKFTSYTDGYKKIRNRLGLRTSPPDLTVTGSMLTLGFYPKLAVTDGVKNYGEGPAIAVSDPMNPRAEGNQMLRYWMGANQHEADAVVKAIIQDYNQQQNEY